ncbi:MAG: branched-chain amino acid transporter AzlD [Clostridiales bacterium]|nr:branched-chain amino acid transporter AzlD [Clostridiales bacterium]
MTLSPIKIIIILFMVSLATIITRFLPFILLKNIKSNNTYMKYLGEVLPYSAIGLIVVYCLRNVDLNGSPYGLPEAIAIIFIIIIHYWKENTLLSIGLGTIIYMLLVQFVFI